MTQQTASVNQKSKKQGRAILVTKVFGPKDFLKFLLLVGLFIGLLYGWKLYTRPDLVSVNQALQDIKTNEVTTIEVLGDEVLLKYKDGSVKRTKIEEGSSFAEILQSEGLKLSDLAEKGIELEVKTPPTQTIEIANLVINALFLGVLAYSVLAFIRFLPSLKRGGMGDLGAFGRSRARLILGKRPDTTLKDVAGLHEVKEEIKTVIDFLKDPQKYREMGARIPKGILLEGPPGTGKTLIARAVAGEAQVPFFYTSGGEFEEMLVGAGAARVRDLFAKARALQPSIIFIDEIDAVAKKRGVDFRTTYSEQTLNQILAEMDGLEKNEAVIVMAATNRADVLDPAIMRPGRFDWRIKFSLPDFRERLEILQLHSKNKKLGPDVDLETIAKLTVGFSGAELESTLNEAAILAVRSGRNYITQDDIIEGMFKVTMGPRRKTLVMTKQDLESTAYHEAGHAIVAAYMPNAPEVQNITIIPRAKALGLTSLAYEYEKTNMSLAELLDRIAVATGGRAAEEVVYGPEHISTGAAGDVESASDIARAIVKKFGMSKKLGFVSYATKDEYLLLGLKKDYSDKTAALIDEEVRNLVWQQYQKALDILKRERKLLDAVAKELMQRESLTKDQFHKLVEQYAKVKPPKKKAKKILPVAEWVNKIRKKSSAND